jgi:tetratricopeptide (TPR) repeat protein
VKRAALGACLALVSANIWAQAEHSAAEHFGTAHLATSCSADVQPQFDRAVAMLHSFFFPETVKAFTAITAAEPSCAMAYWGIAMSQRPNPLVPPFSKELLQAGWKAIEKARAANAPTPRERDWIEAVALFYDDSDTVDQKTRTARYERAMSNLHERYPGDTEIAVFYALALNEAVDLTDKSYYRQLKAAAILEPLAQQFPDHPGIAHLIIHSYDYAPIAARGLPAARRYAALAPSAPHALHMPSHIFSTLGMWREAIAADLASDAATKEYAARSSPVTNTAANPARYHSLDFLMNAYLQLGQDKKARAIVDERNTVMQLPGDYRLSGHTAFAAIPVRYAIERGEWAEAATLTPTPSSYPQAEAITWFGRALGAARSDDPVRARRDVGELARLRAKLAAANDEYWVAQIDIYTQAAEAWIALAEHRPRRALIAMRAAADREDRTEKNVAMENRLSPMRELLGELLLEAGRPDEAQREFDASLQTVPNRYRSLAGAARAAGLLHHEQDALTYHERLLALTQDADSERAAILAARAYVGNHSSPR